MNITISKKTFDEAYLKKMFSMLDHILKYDKYSILIKENFSFKQFEPYVALKMTFNKLEFLKRMSDVASDSIIINEDEFRLLFEYNFSTVEAIDKFIKLQIEKELEYEES